MDGHVFPLVWRVADKKVDIAQPLVMGILNVTPDSFSDGGLHASLDSAIAYGLEMRAAGADIIDVGGESTRPGSDEVSVSEELARVLPVVRALASAGVLVSIDTRHADVARACVEAGAAIINDVSGFRDQAMVDVAAAYDVGLVVMHMAGEPKSMQDSPRYEDVVAEVRDYLLQQAKMLEAAGIARDRICLDPGPGFGKSVAHNAELLSRFNEFAEEGYPVVAAFSRKSCIGAWYGEKEPSDRVWGSAAVAVRAVVAGARVVRVHDVKQTKEALSRLREFCDDSKRASRPVAFVALGSNQGDRLAHLMHAACKIALLVQTEVMDISPVYESEPAYYTDQETFANAVMTVRTALLAPVLLAELQRIELEEGRVRTFPNAPRPLDLDILDYEGECSNDPFCTLPHPKLLERDFTVTPLLDVALGHVLADGVPVTRNLIAYGHIVGTLGELDVPLPRRIAACLRAQSPHASKPGVESLLHGGVACTSTNDEAKRLARQGAVSGSVYFAALQTAGRGRLGRSWESPVGGLYHSYVFRPQASFDHLASLALVVALGVLEGLEEIGCVGGGLKWPNDVLLPEGKVAGILLESAGAGTIVAGIGINVARIENVAYPDCASFVGDAVELVPPLAEIAASVAKHVWQMYGEWEKADYSFEPFVQRYTERLLILGKQVCVRNIDGGVQARGIANGIDECGHLLVGNVPILSGDVTLRD